MSVFSDLRLVELIDVAVGQGLVIEPALQLIGAGNTDEIGLFDGLNALGCDAHIERARHSYAGEHHRAAAVIFARLHDQAAIKLELLKAELAQEPDRSVTRAKIVKRDRETNRAKPS